MAGEKNAVEIYAPDNPMTPKNTIHTLDLNFLGIPNAIAAYLIPHAHGAVLVECGPGSTVQALQDGLAHYGYTPADITDVLLTHIHLDHAGAAGWLAQQGAHIHVHEVGAPHMLDPTKLIRSAARIYGELMDHLWGEFLPVPEQRLRILHDNDMIEIEGLRFKALDTPGHASHHMAYIFEDTCFCGDVGGARMNTPGLLHVRIPAVPPEFHIEKWRQSIARLQEEDLQFIAPTHFGIFPDAGQHLAAVEQGVNEIEAWMESALPADPSLERLQDDFVMWSKQRSLNAGLGEEWVAAFEAANPSAMSAGGIQRYWRKFRTGYARVLL